MELAGKVALITGAGSGMGLATAKRFVDAGAQVAMLDLAAPAQQAESLGGAALPLKADVSDQDAVKSAVEQVLAAFGTVDVAINAAGIAPAAKVIGRDGLHSLELFRKVFDVNVVGLFDVVRRVADAMRGNAADDNGERGVIVNVSSGAAWQGQRGQAAYAASKAAVIGLMLPVAKDLARDGIRVVTVAPGAFDTSMAAGFDSQTRATMNEIPLHPRRMGYPEEFAALAQHIVENPYLNATTLNLDAGARMV